MTEFITTAVCIILGFTLGRIYAVRKTKGKNEYHDLADSFVSLEDRLKATAIQNCEDEQEIKMPYTDTAEEHSRFMQDSKEKLWNDTLFKNFSDFLNEHGESELICKFELQIQAANQIQAVGEKNEKDRIEAADHIISVQRPNSLDKNGNGGC